MPVIVPFSDDSISHALFGESLKNSFVLLRSFASMWMEGRWFSAKTHRWDGMGRRKIAEGHLQEESRCLEHHWSFVFSLLILSLRIVRQIFQTKLYIEESALLWVVHIGAACFSKVTTSVKGCGLRSMSNKMMSNNTVIAWINHKVYQVHSRGCA